ncbi:MAG: AtpZ/AtpI family protein [Bacteroidetes bacterium]|nr:AtpZ/AtpI family protein [Bacteroidota bacterium]
MKDQSTRQPKEKPQKSNQKKQPQNQLNKYVRYSSLAFQMLAIILIGVFGGMKLDRLISWDFPVFTVVLSIITVFGSIFYAVKDLLKPPK